MKKKLISAMIYIYIAVVVGVVASAETITGLGVTFPIGKVLKYSSETVSNEAFDYELEYDGDRLDIKISGVQFAAKVRHIFYSGFVLGADFDVGKIKTKDFYKDEYVSLGADLTIGYAVVDSDRFTLILSAIAGVSHQKYDGGNFYDLDWGRTSLIQRYTAFEFGGELFANFRIGDNFGLFASCKILGEVGKMSYIFDTAYYGEFIDALHKTTAFVVKPSVGVSFTF